MEKQLSTHTRTYKHNITMYMGYSTFSNLLILGPILTLYYLEKGLSFTQIMMISAVSAIGTVIFEVPTGMIADRVGRKYSLMLNSILWAVTCFIYAISNSFWVFLIGEVFFSLGAAFGSGSDSALLYDHLKAYKQEGEYQKIEGRAMSFVFYSQAIGAVLAGYLYKWDNRLPFIVSLIFVLISVIFAWRFEEDKIAVQVAEGEKHSLKSYVNQFRSGFGVIKGNPKLLSTVAMITLLSVFFRGSFPMYQPYMKAVDLDVTYFGWMFFIFNIIAAQASKLAHRAMKATKSWTLIGMGALIVISYFSMGMVKTTFGVFLICIQQLYRGMSRPIFYKYYNKRIPSDIRATVLSTISFMINLCIAAVLPLQGLLMDHVTIFDTHLILGILLLLLMIPAEAWMRVAHKREHML